MLYLRNKKNVAGTRPTIHKIATIALHDTEDYSDREYTVI